MKAVGECVGVLFPSGEVLCEGAFAVIQEFGQAFVEHDAIFEGRVHSLAVERHDRVGGVAHERDLVRIMPWRATDRHE